MALYVEVTNVHSAGSVGRAGYSFKQGETKTGKVAASRANELLDTPLLSCTIVGADSYAEVPQGHDVDANATDAAKKHASNKGVDIFALQGTGKDGQVTKDDVDRFLQSAGSTVKTDRDHYLELHQAGGGSATVTTLDPLDQQLAAQHEALEELEKADAELRASQPGSAGGGESPPSQIADADDGPQSPSPPADVQRAEETQGENPSAANKVNE